MYQIKYNNSDFKDSININKLNFSEIISNNSLINIVIYMKNDEKLLKKYIKIFLKYRKILDKVKMCNIYLQDYEDIRIEQDFVKLIKAIFLIDLRKIYEEAYDIACDYLDSQFYGKNLCDFCNNKCGYKKDTNIEIGCCRHYSKHKQFGALFFEKLVQCENLGKDGKCKIKCIGCKLFTCDYLERKGIKFKTNDILAIDSIFNPLQKILLKAIVYTPKEEIIDKLLFLA